MTALLPAPPELALFAGAVLVLNATPGVDFLLTVQRTLAGGPRAGVAAAAGIGAGCVVHALAAAFGRSRPIRRLPRLIAFVAVRAVRRLARGGPLAGHARRIELLWDGQHQSSSLPDLGFDVGEVELVTSPEGVRLRVDTRVAEPGQHRRELFRLTGLEMQENQARRLLNDIRSFRAWLEQLSGRPVPDSVAGHRWLAELY